MLRNTRAPSTRELARDKTERPRRGPPSGYRDAASTADGPKRDDAAGGHGDNDGITYCIIYHIVITFERTGHGVQSAAAVETDKVSLRCHAAKFPAFVLNILSVV